MTCVSAASRPAAKLTWLLNDMPVPTKWLNYQQTPINSEYQLIESKLTIAFKLQASHLLKNQLNASTLNNRERAQQQMPATLQRYQQLKLSCSAKLSVEYTSETNILVSGGKTSVKRRRQQQKTEMPNTWLPLPSSWHSDESTVINYQNGQMKDQHQNGELPIYKWPQPTSTSDGQNLYNRLNGGNRRTIGFLDNNDDNNWQPNQTQNSDRHHTYQENTSGVSSQHNNYQPRFDGLRNHQVVVWTRKQLRDQAEHIELMLRGLQPNEIEAPSIEANTKLDEDKATESANGDEINSDSAHDSLPVSVSVDKGDESPSSNTTDDYDLGDKIEFVCIPSVNSIARDTMRNVRLKWFINNQEVSYNSSQVTLYDCSIKN